MMNDNKPQPVRPVLSDGNGYTNWQNTIAVTGLALEEATRIPHSVRDNLKRHQLVRELKEGLRTARSDLDRYRHMHACAVTNLRQFESISDA